MTRADPPHDYDTHAELAALLSAWVDGALDEAGQARLEKRLLASESAAAFAVDWLDQHAALGATSGDTVRADVPESYPIYRAGCEPKPGRGVGQLVAISALAAAVFVACGIAIYLLAFNASPSTIDPNPTQPGPPIATVIESSDTLVIDNEIGNPGDDYAAGDYHNEGGTAELQLTSGANVRVLGRTDMTLHSSMAATLTEGYASFRCPPSAHGYTVYLPGGARAIDLGTAFDIDVRGDAFAVTVTEGRIGFVPSPDAEIGYLLQAGASVAIDADGTFSEPKPVASVRTIASVETNTENPWVVVPGGFDEDVVALIGRPAQWNGLTEAGLPAELIGHDMVRAARDDSNDPNLRVELTLMRPAVVYVIWNSKVDPADWLTADYERTDLAVGLDSTNRGKVAPGVGPGKSINVEFHVWRRTVDEAGVIELGPNGNIGSNHAPYGIVAAPVIESERNEREPSKGATP